MGRLSWLCWKGLLLTLPSGAGQGSSSPFLPLPGLPASPGTWFPSCLRGSKAKNFAYSMRKFLSPSVPAERPHLSCAAPNSSAHGTCTVQPSWETSCFYYWQTLAEGCAYQPHRGSMEALGTSTHISSLPLTLVLQPDVIVRPFSALPSTPFSPLLSQSPPLLY